MTEQAEAMEAAKPFLTVVKGNPSDAEIAALVGVFASAGGSDAPADTGPRNLWGTPSDRLRAATGLGPSVFPNLAFGY
ncbi:acyl-CoA carboxylase epsilon subunit-like protein [Williamsia limnetica]|uniref:Acyl-CoA carboxylase epsilon subunit-like protein n=1 Tax=Williamsia limnetica TaxID=882452 RepID=A0A318RL01_WILLI|nr:acyl-CoA carboxylase subunit epsilon [Williamsia limnetica]PYE14740.1 acyl-CoA carboxylase epsilon subunit-like protein [Williamsia limnetica]